MDTVPCRACGGGGGSPAGEGFCPSCLAAAVLGVEGIAPGGRRLGGYELEEELGRGGVGVVYRARQTELGREVAVKVLRSGPFASPSEVARFRREASAAAALAHPNIVTVHEIGSSDGHVFFSMELVEGPTLADRTRSGPLEPRRAAGYLIPVAEAIAAAHEAGVLHGDIKPGNILLDPRDRPRVTDFGLARSLEPEGDGGRQTRPLAGSPGYMSPEQAEPDRGPLSVRSDVYALGATLYHLVTGRPPFAAATPAATLRQVVEDEPAPPRRLNSQVPRDLETVCLKCLQKDPGARYAGARELAADLRAFLENRPVSARRPGPVDRLRLWVRRRPTVAALGLCLAATLTAGGVIGLWQARQGRLNLYAADLRVAAEALGLGDLGRARELLDLHAPGDAHPDLAWRLLNGLAAGDTRVVLGEHVWIVGALAWSRDGRRVASASVPSGTVDADLRIWEPDRPGVGPVILSPLSARQLDWFPDSRRLLAVHFDGSIRIWDVDRRIALEEYAGRSGGITADGTRLVSCEGDPFPWNDHGPVGAVVLRNLESGRTEDLPPARLAAVSPGGRWVATTRFDGRIQVREVVTGSVRDLECDLSVWSLCFSPDDLRLVATGFGGDPLMWSLAEPAAPPRRFPGHSLSTWAAVFSPDGSRLVTTSSDQAVRLWEDGGSAPARLLRGHGGEVWAAAFSPDGRRLVSGGKDRAVLLWPLAVPAHNPVVAGPPYARPVFSSDGGEMYLRAGRDGQGWEVHGLPDGGWRRASVPADGAMVATGADAPWRAWRDLLPPDSVPWPGGGPGLERDVGEAVPERWCVSGDRQWVMGWAPGGALSRWEARSGRRRGRVVLPGVEVASLHPAPDSGSVVVCAGEAGFWVAHWAPGRVIRLEGHLDQAKWADVSPDGGWIATASVDGTVRLWRRRDGRPEGVLRGHRTGVGGVAFGPDGITLASCEPGVGIRLWHLPTRREVAVLDLPEAGEWLGFSPDGRALVVERAAGGVRILGIP